MTNSISAWKRKTALRLRSKGELRISPEFPDIVEINCRFEFFPTQRAEAFWVPLCEVIATPLGHFLHLGHFEAASLPQQIVKIRDFRPMQSVHARQLEQHVIALCPNGEIAHGALNTERDYWVDDRQKPPIAIAKTEYTRFVAAAFGSFSDHLLDLDLDPDGLFDAMCDMDETGLDGDIFRIKARPGFTDRSTLYQLALLQSEPDYLDALRRLGRGIRISVAGIHGCLPDVTPPATGLSLKIGIDEMPDQSSPQLPLKGFPKAITASRIISDQRKFKFRRIIAEVPFEYGEEAIDDPLSGELQSDQDRANRRRYGQDLNIDPTARPGRNRPTLTISSGSIFTNFPCLRTTILETITQRSVDRKAGAPRPEKQSITNFSPLPPSGDAMVGQLKFNASAPSLQPREPLPLRETGDRFLEGTPVMPNMISIAQSELDPLYSAFVDAGLILANWGQIEAGFSSIARSARRVVSLFELTQDHGVWAWSVRHNRGRRVLAHVLTLDQETVVALEIERLKRRDCFSIGLLHPCEPVSDLDTVGQLVGRVAERNSSLHDRGTWPPRHFDDVRFATLIHSGNRDIPNKLADALMEKAERLCSHSS
jgi:hypothetical protein